jgi:hypothetical protein
MHAFAVRGKREVQAQDLSVLFGLLQSVSGQFVLGLGFNHSRGHFRRIAKKRRRYSAFFAFCRVALVPATTIRPAVNCRCSAIDCGSVSQPAVCSLGTTYFRQVSASVGVRVNCGRLGGMDFCENVREFTFYPDMIVFIGIHRRSVD